MTITETGFDLQQQLNGPEFAFVPQGSRAFIAAFDQGIQQLGFTANGEIGSGYCWGKYRIVYRNASGKTRKNPACIYIREDGGFSLRLYFNSIDQHRAYIEGMSEPAQRVFTDPVGNCTYCKTPANIPCRFRKEYTLNGVFYQKCNGVTFEIREPVIDDLAHYLALLQHFYPGKK